MTTPEHHEQWLSVRMGERYSVCDLPQLDPEVFVEALVEGRERGGRLAQLFGRRGDDGAVGLYAFLAYDSDGSVEVTGTSVSCGASSPGRYPSVTARWPAAQAFEREIAEQFGITPVGHPWLKPLRYHGSDTGAAAPWGAFDPAKPIPGDYPFYRVDGAEVHEVAVGPVHAGVIEPGHFRFQCHGEEVLHLEIVLGYQRRGAEALLAHRNPNRALMVAETLAGDTSIGHALPYCAAIEALAGTHVSFHADTVRGVALELERLANHVGDLGALCGDVAYLPGASYLGRLRGEFLNLTLEICGNRFGRGLVRPGGVRFDLFGERAAGLRAKLERLQGETLQVLDLMFSESSVLARFEGTGALSMAVAEEIGLVGPAGRACGCMRDVRQDHPSGVYRFSHLPIAGEATGDVYGRAVVRWLEIQRSLEFLLELLERAPSGDIYTPPGALAPNAMAFGLCEGWRGETMHVVFTDGAGEVAFVKAKDPSIHNWLGLALAMRGGAISDFPICNKSFSLSYAGHDL